jgi:hypothetical protein
MILKLNHPNLKIRACIKVVYKVKKLYTQPIPLGQ